MSQGETATVLFSLLYTPQFVIFLEKILLRHKNSSAEGCNINNGYITLPILYLRNHLMVLSTADIRLIFGPNREKMLWIQCKWVTECIRNIKL